MKGKKEKITEEDIDKELNNIDNYKIDNNIKVPYILKKELKIENNNCIRKENYNNTNVNKFYNEEIFSEKREIYTPDSEVSESITTENVSKEKESEVNNLNEKKSEVNNLNEKESEVNNLNEKESEVNNLNEKESEVNNLNEKKSEVKLNEKKSEVNNLNEKESEINNMNEKEKDVNDLSEKEKENEDPKIKGNLKDYYQNLPTVIIVIGMAGSGKTTYVGSLYKYLKIEKKKKVYTINLDPAVKYLQYPTNIDIRDSIKYHEIMKEYKLGPNGAIMTCLNLFATRFDKVIEILEKRKQKLNYIIVDTPGQIEVFNWSASGNIILETLSVSFPVVINYVIDTVRCERPITFMSNMLYACSVLYKSRLPFLACFNKIDIIKHDKCIEWMKNYDSFNEDVLNDESYMASFSRSCALMINEFYEGIKTVGISSKTNEGFNNILKNLEYLKEEYISDYVPCIEKQMKRIKKKKEKDIKLKMESLLMEKQKNIPISKN
ncbi:XPA binding protein 1, putative [Plasmodium gallinaceum]|uniref:GPN-loop GTPase 1 n=1 Tax=Plasmodium gallinaceum TaxID=5849 RepID=A0A1J1GTY7_PLAGA|nr:XPA binding protein 1, putative [Plasmodium gallinaceum]CRG95990.1 XPA binding protein 1, putative [Plasmodium gallinaceum]